MSSFIIKIIAIITMVADHCAFLFDTQPLILRCIGRISFPLFAFQITNGYIHTKNFKKYILRLFILALISQIPFSLLFQSYTLNIFFTLIFGLLCIYFYDKSHNKLIGIIPTIVICILSFWINFDYGIFGILSILIFYIFKDNKLYMNISYILLCILNYLPALINSNFYYPNIIMLICTIFPIIFINFYNGKKGKNIKIFFYIFYPLHIIILYLIKICNFF